MEYKITSKSEKDTIELAENFEAEKIRNMVICLNGDLGSGKTVFAKGFAAALGIDEVITSPTFNIIKEYYSGEMPLFHMDAYRLEDSKKNIGIEEYFDKEGIVIIEWSEMIKDILPDERLEFSFKVIGENTRIIKIIPYGTKYEEICEDVL